MTNWLRQFCITSLIQMKHHQFVHVSH
jgi:hypothetical protein